MGSVIGKRNIVQIDEPPSVFVRKVHVERDMKRLLNFHRILHAWMAEVTSSSPRNEIGEYRWTPRWIKVAHDAVVRRIKQLNPSFRDETPMLGGEWKIPPLREMLLIPEYVSVVGSRVKEGKGPDEADLDIVVRDKEVNESLDVRLAKALGEDIHIIYNPQGPHDEEHIPLFHLVLVPIEQWHERHRPSVKTALDNYFAALGDMVELMPERAVKGASIVRRRLAEAIDSEDAKMIGIETAQWVMGGGKIPDLPIEVSLGDGSDDLLDIAFGMYDATVVPLNDMKAYREGERRIRNQLDKWKRRNPFKNRAEAEDAARELGISVAKDILEEYG